MGRVCKVILLIDFVLKCNLVPLPCSNNCLKSSEDTCEAVPCTNGCNPGWHGNNCNKQCSQSCKHLICNQDDGSCTEEHLFEPISLRLSDNCLERDSQNINKCRCCAPKYRGDNCETICDHCHTVKNQECHYICRAGYYGTTCNQTCPESCEKGNYGKPVCNEKDGAVTCSYGCPLGRFGNMCDQSCNEDCKNACMQSSGNCVDCFDGYYGDKCDKPCDLCVDRKCFRNGSCVEKCVDNKNCTRPCPKNCKQFNNSQCDNSNGTALTCIHGCIDGFYGQTCEHACDKCTTCNQNSGECFSTHDTADTAASGNIGAIIGGVTGAVGIAVSLLIAYLIWKYKKVPECCRCFTRANNNGTSKDETIPTEVQQKTSVSPSEGTSQNKRNSRPSPGLVAKRVQHIESGTSEEEKSLLKSSRSKKVQPRKKPKQLESVRTTTASGKDEPVPTEIGEKEALLETDAGKNVTLEDVHLQEAAKRLEGGETTTDRSLTASDKDEPVPTGEEEVRTESKGEKDALLETDSGKNVTLEDGLPREEEAPTESGGGREARTDTGKNVTLGDGRTREEEDPTESGGQTEALFETDSGKNVTLRNVPTGEEEVRTESKGEKDALLETDSGKNVTLGHESNLEEQEENRGIEPEDLSTGYVKKTTKKFVDSAE